MTEHLTSERFRKKYKTNFDLANASIRLARNLVKSGQFTSLDQLLNLLERERQNMPSRA